LLAKINEEEDNYLAEYRHQFEGGQLVKDNNLIEYIFLEGYGEFPCFGLFAFFRRII